MQDNEARSLRSRIRDLESQIMEMKHHLSKFGIRETEIAAEERANKKQIDLLRIKNEELGSEREKTAKEKQRVEGEISFLKKKKNELVSQLQNLPEEELLGSED